MNTLKIKDLSITYPNGTKALSAVNLTIGNGMFGLLGPNGAGKSSLMRTLATLQKPTNGKVYFNDTNVIQAPNVLRKILGYLPQEFGVYPKISAWDLLNHVAVLKGIINKKQRTNQINSLLQQTNLYADRKKSVSSYSGGMRQRFGIAQALLGNPQLIIVDEPTAGLDPEERNRFHNLLSDIGKSIIIILSTHIVDDVLHLCSNMAIMGKGEIVAQGVPQQLMAKLDGKIWIKTIDKQHIDDYKSLLNVLSAHLHMGKVQLRIFSEDDPRNGFQLASANLEDVYFSTLKRHKK